LHTLSERHGRLKVALSVLIGEVRRRPIADALDIANDMPTVPEE
jgi:hypothetical protein